MYSRKRSLILGILVICLSLTPSKANYSVFMNVQNAFYQDLDGDLVADDIHVSIQMDMYRTYIQHLVDVYVGIEKPSGEQIWFLASFSIIQYDLYATYFLEYDLMNTATESGWYWVHAVGFNDMDSVSVVDSMRFDPPGQSKDGNPYGLVSITSP